MLLSAPVAACVAAGPAVVTTPAASATARLEDIAGGGVRVRRTVAPAYTLSDGALAKAEADVLCGGVQSSIYDRFEAGSWVFVEGCA